MIVKNCQVITVCHISYYKYISELLRVKSSSQATQTSAHRLEHPSVSSAVAGGKGKAMFGVCGHSVWAAGGEVSRNSVQQQECQESSDIPPAQSCSEVWDRTEPCPAQTPSGQGNWDGKQSQGTAGSCAAALKDFSKLCSWCSSSSGITGLCFADKNKMRICMTPWKQTQRFTLSAMKPMRPMELSLLFLGCAPHSPQS